MRNEWKPNEERIRYFMGRMQEEVQLEQAVSIGSTFVEALNDMREGTAYGRWLYRRLDEYYQMKEGSTE